MSVAISSQGDADSQTRPHDMQQQSYIRFALDDTDNMSFSVIFFVHLLPTQLAGDRHRPNSQEQSANGVEYAVHWSHKGQVPCHQCL